MQDDSGHDSDYLPQKDKYEYSDAGHEFQKEKTAGFSRKADEKSGIREDQSGEIKQNKWMLRHFVMIRSKKKQKTPETTENMLSRDQCESQLEK